MEFFRRCPRKYMYMAIVRTEEEVRQALGYPGVNLVGMEFQASTPQDPLYQDEAIRSAQEAGLFVWANAIKLWPTEVGSLFAGLDDDGGLGRRPRRLLGRDDAQGRPCDSDGLALAAVTLPCPLF